MQAIRVSAWEDLAAMAVFRQLDAADQIEAELIRGRPGTALALFADWRSLAPHALVNVILETAGGTPFAVLAVSHTGQAGVAQAALLARDHARFRRPLAQAALAIRARMPGWAVQNGVHRIEARAWTGHPSACRLLSAIGFVPECDMPGFGPGGAAVYRQFAWVTPALSPSASPAPAATAPASRP